MSETIRLAFATVVGYVLGSLPFPYLLARARGQDLFRIGTNNPGAANLFRRVSKPLGVLGAILDLSKGAAAVVVARWLGLSGLALVIAGAGAMVGHWYSVFLGFRGGEALATVVGVGIGLAPVAAAAGIAVGLLILAIIRNVGNAAGLAWPVFMGVALWEGTTWPVVVGATCLPAAVTIRSAIHRRKKPAAGKA